MSGRAARVLVAGRILAAGLGSVGYSARFAHPLTGACVTVHGSDMGRLNEEIRAVIAPARPSAAGRWSQGRYDTSTSSPSTLTQRPGA